jgi:predicted secreted hydrolase
MHEGFFDPLAKFTATLVESVAGVVVNDSSVLHQCKRAERVVLPRDMFAHADVQTEWWYYTGHCETESGRKFGFELAFFKRRTDLDKFGTVPLRLIANPMYAAHFAISEIETKKFQYDHIRSFGLPFDTPVRMSEDEYSLQLGEWSIGGDRDVHILHATFPNGLSFDAVLTSKKTPILHGLDGCGVSERNTDETSQHFSFTRMDVTGTISMNERSEEFNGIGWMDREFGTWQQTHWDWFSIQLDDDTELMIYHFRDLNNGRREYSHGRFIYPDGSSKYLSNDDFDLTATDEWTSKSTGATYPNKWRINVPCLEIELEISPMIDHQELDTRGTSMVVYWEGVCDVSGTSGGLPVNGNSYVELVGYDSSHENPSLLSFFLGKSIRI